MKRKIRELSEKLASGDLSVPELCRFYLERIERIDKEPVVSMFDAGLPSKGGRPEPPTLSTTSASSMKSGRPSAKPFTKGGPSSLSTPTSSAKGGLPKALSPLNSVIEVNPNAMEIAEKLQAELETRGPRSILHGLPVLLKDNIDTGDRLQSTAGSLALSGTYAPKDARLVERLREAGVLILGKTNLSEWANFRSTRSISGWSSRGGQTVNPYDRGRSPCGSSSGSAVAVAADLALAAIGTETDGSIVCPASVNGIVGIKPTVGTVSRRGIVPISYSQDTAGPMAASVEDALVLLSVMAETVRTAERTELNLPKPENVFEYLDKGPSSLEGIRIGVARNYFGFHEKVDKVINNTIEKIRILGANVVDPANIETKGEFEDDEFTLLLYEFKDSINRYLKERGDTVSYHSLSELIRFNRENSDTVMPYFGQNIFEMANKKGPLTEKEYIEVREKAQHLAGREGLEATFNKYQLDAIVAPSNGPAWLIDTVNGDYYTGGSSSPAAVSGYPSITIPVGFVSGLPVGISFIGKPFCDFELGRIAFLLEGYLYKNGFNPEPKL